jgi:hypothetical protein
VSDYFDKQGNPLELLEWAKLKGDKDFQRVAYDEVHPYFVSTVWLGLDHGYNSGSPVIFETMVFELDLSTSVSPAIGDLPEREYQYHKSLDQYTRRYSTEDDAWVGHRQIVKQLTKLNAGG